MNAKKRVLEAAHDDLAPVLWHISVDGAVQGPYPEARILQMLRAGELGPRAHAWTEGMKAWKRLAEIAPFRDELTPRPARAAPPLVPLFDDVEDAPGVLAPRESTATFVAIQRASRRRDRVLAASGIAGVGALIALVLSHTPVPVPVVTPQPPVENPPAPPAVTLEDAPVNVRALGEKRATQHTRVKEKTRPQTREEPAVVVEKPAGPPMRAHITLPPLEVSSSGAPPRRVNPLSDDTLALVYNRHRNEMSSCVQHASRTRGGAGYTLRVTATIASDGKVQRADVKGAGDDEAVARCVRRAVSSWTFPAFDGEPFDYAFSVGG